MTSDKRFALIWAKIERANKHISDLGTAIETFLAIKPYKVGMKRDAETKKPIYYMAQVQPIPTEICIILGDAIHNLRAALDHLAQQTLSSRKRDHRLSETDELLYCSERDGVQTRSGRQSGKDAKRGY